MQRRYVVPNFCGPSRIVLFATRTAVKFVVLTIIETYDYQMVFAKWMIVEKYRHCLDASTALKEKGFTVVATCLDDDAVPISDVDFGSFEKICVMFGNEERGLSWALRNEADVKVYIPMSGFSQSFNISVTCAMTLFHLREKGVIVPDIDDEQMNKLYLRWLLMSTKRSASLLKKHNYEHLAPDFV